MSLKFGRRPVRHTAYTNASLAVLKRHLAALGPPPAATNNWPAAVKIPFGMALNDTLGCCVCSDVAHVMMLNTANASTIFVPTDRPIRKLYQWVGGYIPGDPSTDNGCDMTTMDEFLKAKGFCGSKLDAYAMVDYSSVADLTWCVQLFGSCAIGINFPTWAMDAFNAGEPWGAPPKGADTTIEGGHDIPLVYSPSSGTFQCVTWGQLQTITMAFISAYCQEAHARLGFDWIRKQGTAPSGFDLKQLAADLAEIE